MRTRIILILLTILGISWYSYQYYQSSQPVVDSYESCVDAKGSAIQESYPATCVSQNGASYIEIIYGILPSTTPQEWKTFRSVRDYEFRHN